MKALTFGAAALTLALVAQPAAAAVTISVRVTDGATTTVLTSNAAGGALNFTGTTANFSISGNAVSAPVNAEPDFSTNSFNILTNGSAGAKTLKIEITAQGLTQSVQSVMNTFTLNSLNGGSFTTGTVSNFFDLTNAAYGTGTLLGSSTFNGRGSFSEDVGANFAPTTGTYSETAVYTLNFAGGAAGQVGASAQLSAVPEPATWAMMLVGFGAIGGTMRRRNVRARVQFA